MYFSGSSNSSAVGKKQGASTIPSSPIFLGRRWCPFSALLRDVLRGLRVALLPLSVPALLPLSCSWAIVSQIVVDLAASVSKKKCASALSSCRRLPHSPGENVVARFRRLFSQLPT